MDHMKLCNGPKFIPPDFFLYVCNVVEGGGGNLARLKDNTLDNHKSDLRGEM